MSGISRRDFLAGASAAAGAVALAGRSVLGAEKRASKITRGTDLVTLGRRVESDFGGPQDIEWTWAEHKLSLVQSRPITSLYPLPAGVDPQGELKVFGSVAAFQGMLDPFTPLGQDALKSLVVGIARLARRAASGSVPRSNATTTPGSIVNVTPSPTVKLLVT